MKLLLTCLLILTTAYITYGMREIPYDMKKANLSHVAHYFNNETPLDISVEIHIPDANNKFRSLNMIFKSNHQSPILLPNKKCRIVFNKQTYELTKGTYHTLEEHNGTILLYSKMLLIAGQDECKIFEK